MKEDEIEQEIVVATDNRNAILRIKVVDEDSSLMAQRAVKEVSGQIREIEKQRKELIAPMLEAQRKTNALFKRWTGPLDEINKHLRKELVGYEQRQEEKRRAAEEEALASTDDPSEYLAKITQAVTPSAKAAGVSIQKTWKGRVVDFSKLPDEFKIIDQSKINKAVKLAGGEIDIPGVEVYQEKKVRA